MQLKEDQQSIWLVTDRSFYPGLGKITRVRRRFDQKGFLKINQELHRVPSQINWKFTRLLFGITLINIDRFLNPKKSQCLLEIIKQVCRCLINLECIKKYIDKEPPYLMCHICVLRWEEIKTKNSGAKHQLCWRGDNKIYCYHRH